MGKAVEEVALERDHAICARITDRDVFYTRKDLGDPDVAIEFTTPEAAAANIVTCIEDGIPIVSGTTGWLEKLSWVHEKVAEHKGTFLHTTNFSPGVNIFKVLNEYLAQLMNGQHSYTPSIHEVHHKHKVDAPSGTAITLAEEMIGKLDAYNEWHKGNEEREGSVPVSSDRKDDVPGTHEVQYRSAIDNIEIKHTAHNRRGFALGAVLAAEYIHGKTGIFTMKDVLKLNG